MEVKSELSVPVYNGMRGSSKIRGGIDVDIAKSALQKAIRRGDVSLAWTMGVRLNEFLNVDDGKGKGVRSNMLNRLPVIAGEDIGMGNLNVVMMVDEYVNKIRDAELKLCESDLIECITMMCLSTKSRLGSHVNAVFYQSLSTPEYFERLCELKPGILDVMKNIENHAKLPNIKDVSDEDRFLVGRCWWLLRNAKSDDEKMATFFYMRILLNSENKYKIPRGYPKKRNISSEPIFMVWNDMLDIVSPRRRKMLELCYKMFLNENERHIYLVLGLFVFFYMDEVKSEVVDVNSVIEKHGGIEKIVYLAMNENIVIPEYAIDKHTKKGRSKGKDSVVFAVEGAVVENESEWMKKWKSLGDLYIDFRKFCPKFTPRLTINEIIDSWNGKLRNGKREVEEIKKEKKVIRKSKKTCHDEADNSWIEELSGLLTQEERLRIMDDSTPRGQVLTSKWKKYVYMPLEDNFVYKGPWKMEGSSDKEKGKLKKLKFRFEVCDLFGANVLKGEVLKDDERNLWVKYPCLSCVDTKKWILNCVTDKITEKEIKVIDRKSLGILQLSSYPEKEIMKCLFEKNLYCDFLLLYILGVGDTGLYNVLTFVEEVFIIDIDDDTTKSEFRELFDVFGRRPSEGIVKLIEEGVKKNKEMIGEYLTNLENKVEDIVKIGEKNGLKIDREEIVKKVVNVKNVVLK